MALPLSSNAKLSKVITEVNALGVLIAGLRSELTKLKSLTAEIESDNIVIRVRITVLEEKLAALTPCPDPDTPDPEEPPDPPDPLPDPPVEPELHLIADPTTLAFTSTNGGAVPAAKTILLTQSGVGVMLQPQVVSSNDPDGIIQGIGISAVGILLDSWNAVVTPTASKPAGSYSASFVLRSPNQTNASINITVTHVVAAAPVVPLTLNLSTASVDVGVVSGQDATPINVTLTKGGDGTLAMPTAGVPSEAWISGVVITGAHPTWNAQLTFNTDALADGLHVATVAFSSANATNNPRTLTVNLLVDAAPAHGYSALDALDTEVYDPEPLPANINCTLPQVFLDTRYDPGGVALVWASDTTLVDSGNPVTNAAVLQAAMDASLTRNGHTRIKLPDGFVALGIHRAGVHTQGNHWTYVQRVALGVAGTRCTVAGMAAAPILRTNVNNRAALETTVRANRWRFDEVAFETSAVLTQAVINPGPTNSNGDPSGSTVNDLPEYIYFNRCDVRGPVAGETKNGLQLHTRHGAIISSRIRGIFRAGVESHGLMLGNARGPLKIVNNYIEAASIGMLSGGQNPFTNCIATDVEYRRNHHTLRDSWNPHHGTFDGIGRNVKNRFELKCGERWLIEGNVFEKSPQEAQNGECVGIKSMAGESGLNAPTWYHTKDICLRYNIFRDCGEWMYCIGVQSPHLETLGGTSRIAFFHNLVYNVLNAAFGTAVTRMALQAEVPHMTLDHITAVPHIASIGPFVPTFTMLTDQTANDGGSPGMVIRDCILHGGRYDTVTKWAFTNNTAIDGEIELARRTGSNYILQNTFLIDGRAASFPTGEMNCSVASMAAMNFTGDNPASGLDGDSPAKNAASDGTDCGCNYTKVNLATSGVV